MLSLENSSEQVESLWVNIRGQGKKWNLMASVCCGHPMEGCLLMKRSYFNCRKHHAPRLWSSCRTSVTLTSAGKAARQAASSPGDLVHQGQLLNPGDRWPNQKRSITKPDELIGEVKTGGSLGLSDHALLEFTISRATDQVKSKAKTLNFRRVNFQLFRELQDGTSRETALRDEKQNRAGSFLSTFFLEHKSSQFPCVRNQARSAGHRHD